MNPKIAAMDLLAEVEAMIAETTARMEAYDERAALQQNWDISNAATTERAQQALLRPERFTGEHDVARAWLIHHAERIWSRY